MFLACKIPESSVLVLNWVNWNHLEMTAAPWLRWQHVIDLLPFHLHLCVTRSSKLDIGRDHERYEYHPLFCHNLLAESHCKVFQINTSPSERVLLLIWSPYLLCVRLVVEFVWKRNLPAMHSPLHHDFTSYDGNTNQNLFCRKTQDGKF
jgi:hypothetical protein